VTIIDEIEFEDALRRRLEPVFGDQTQPRMDAMAVKALMDRKRDFEILSSFARALEAQ